MSSSPPPSPRPLKRQRGDETQDVDGSGDVCDVHGNGGNAPVQRLGEYSDDDDDRDADDGSADDDDDDDDDAEHSHGVFREFDDVYEQDSSVEERQKGSGGAAPSAIEAGHFFGKGFLDGKSMPTCLLRVLRRVAHNQDTRVAKSGLFRVFSRQRDAFDFLDQQAPTSQPLRVFAFEIGRSSDHRRLRGARKFVVCSVDTFWSKYCLMSMHERHYYEVIREGTPCRLYFDLEFKRLLNPDVNGDRLVSRFVEHLRQALRETLQVDLRDEDVVDLASTSDSKFSRHLICHLFLQQNPETSSSSSSSHPRQTRQECMFCSNLDAGRFVRKVVAAFPEGMVNTEHGPTPFVDLGVYTRNRTFRLYLSSKFGKNAWLLRAGESQYPLWPTSLHPAREAERRVFLRALICHSELPVGQVHLLDYAPLDKTHDSGGHSEAGTAAEEHCSSGGVLSAEVRYVHRLRTLEPSPFHGVDAFVTEEMIRKGGYIRSWKYFPGAGIIRYQVGGNRFCAHIQREHKSNNVYVVADIGKGHAYQQCHDPVCRAAMFRSPLVAIPHFALHPEERDDAELEAAMLDIDTSNLRRE